jgi:hypothetical protein
MSDAYDPRDYMFTLYYDQHDTVWVAEAEGTGTNADHSTSHLRALAELERVLSARVSGMPATCATLEAEHE